MIARKGPVQARPVPGPPNPGHLQSGPPLIRIARGILRHAGPAHKQSLEPL
jgi:hypothetical protein